MYEHLQALILSQVECSCLVYGLGLVFCKILHSHVHGLLVALDELWLRGVGNAADARRQYIVHGLLVVVLLYVYCAHFHCSVTAGSVLVQVLLIHAPFAAHQVKAAESQNDWSLKPGQEHAHETY